MEIIPERSALQYSEDTLREFSRGKPQAGWLRVILNIAQAAYDKHAVYSVLYFLKSQNMTNIKESLMCRLCEERSDEAISNSLISQREIASLRSQ